MKRFLCLVALAGCSSGSSAIGTGTQCAARQGSYNVTYTAQTAGCPALTSQTTVSGSPLALGEQGTTVTGCSNAGSASPDDCIVTFDTTCPAATAGPATESRGSVTWDTAGTNGTGTTEITPAGSPPCTYSLALSAN